MRPFKNLSLMEKREHRRWARENYVPLTDIKGAWHPVVQEECVAMNREAGERKEDGG